MAKLVDFWEEYTICVRNTGIPDVQVQWFLRWVEQFSRHLRGVPLRRQSHERIIGQTLSAIGTVEHVSGIGSKLCKF